MTSANATSNRSTALILFTATQVVLNIVLVGVLMNGGAPAPAQADTESAFTFRSVQSTSALPPKLTVSTASTATGVLSFEAADFNELYNEEGEFQKTWIARATLSPCEIGVRNLQNAHVSVTDFSPDLMNASAEHFKVSASVIRGKLEITCHIFAEDLPESASQRFDVSWLAVGQRETRARCARSGLRS